MLRVVISDTSPLHYLILIGGVELLPALYIEVLVPEAVADELRQPATPEPVRQWIVQPALLAASCSFDCPTAMCQADLDRGEQDAILLAAPKEIEELRS